MKHEILSEALNELRDDYIKEASAPAKKRSFPWIAAIAAVLALAILLGALLPPAAPTASDPHLQEPPHSDPAPTQQTAPTELSTRHLQYLAAAPSYPKLSAYPVVYSEAAHDAWHTDQRQLHSQPEGYADNLQAYFGSLLAGLLCQDTQRNIACSPVNIYMALAMLAETTAGESRQQLLQLLQAKDIESLRLQANQVWQGHYNNDGLTTSILANSLWLEDTYPINEETAQLLAKEYYASVFRTDLGSAESTAALQDWLNEQTGGLLRQQAADLSLDPTCVMALASTVFYQVQWLDAFQQENNTEAVFHSPSGDADTTYMNTTLSYGPYFWADHFSAVYLPLEDGGRMWFFLPDEGFTPDQIVDDVTGFLLEEPATYASSYENQKSMIVNLSVPKFDIASDMELSDYIKALGVTDIFDPNKADFSPIIPGKDGGCISQVQHAARVSIDEKGVSAAAFTVILRCGSAMPPEEEIDFVLDRPFLFYIESDDSLPMFTGIVNQP